MSLKRVREEDEETSFRVQKEKVDNLDRLDYPPTSTHPTTRVTLQQPLQLTTFSYTAQRKLIFDNSAMKYYTEPPRGAKLDYGYQRWIQRGEKEEKGRIDSLLLALERIQHGKGQDGEAGKERVKGLGVVSWRGVMTKILIAPYEEREGWALNVMKVGGTLYFEEFISDAKIQEKQDVQGRQRMLTYYGYAFESYCTVDGETRSRDRNGWSGDVNNNVQWCSVVRTKLGNTRILIGGEVDCVRDRYTGQPDTFVELKTSLVIRGGEDRSRFEKKLLRIYFQSFLLGVPEIVVGFRTARGVVQTVQRFRTAEIPGLMRGRAGMWDAGLCLEWGERFLEFVAQHARGPEGMVWRVWFSGEGVVMRALDQAEVAEVTGGEDRTGFLPGWYHRCGGADE